jgi:hypothetical protein
LAYHKYEVRQSSSVKCASSTGLSTIGRNAQPSSSEGQSSIGDRSRELE